MKALQEEQQNRALLTFKIVAEEWIADRVKHNYWAKNPRGEKTTRGVLQKHVYPTLGDISIEEISPEMVRDCLAPIWQDLTATAKKAKSYMHKVFQWAIATHKRQNREDPTSFDGAFGVLIEPLQNNLKPTTNHAACAVEEIPQLFAEMHAYGSMSAMACMFAILTASKSQAVRLAKWDEIDFKNRIWTIPVEHDKVKSPNRDRTIFLSSSALRLLERVPRFNDSPFIFPSRQGGHFSDVAFTMFLRGLHAKRLTQDGIGWVDSRQTDSKGNPSIITLHGTARASFRTWAKDDTLGNNKRFNQEAVELCLLHAKNDVYNGAYDRAPLAKERRKIMEAWGKYCSSLL